MRFIHIADVHLGAEPDAGTAYSGERPVEIWETFERVIGICEREQTDLLLIAGDLFHRQPLRRELKEVNSLFAGLTHTRVVLMAGNHDHIRKDSAYLTFPWNDNVYPLFDREAEYVEFPDLETSVTGLSYHGREIREPLYNQILAPGVQRYEILLAHGGDEKHIPIDFPALENAGFDYVALGHIHKPQAVKRDRMIYAGALEPVDRNDTGPHGYVRGEIREGRVKVQWLPCAKREYIHLELAVEENDTSAAVRKKIEKLTEEKGNENIYKVVLVGRRDADIVFDTGGMDRRGNITEIVDHTRPALDFEKLARENPNTLLGRYIGMFSGCGEESTEYRALCEGVEALLENKGLQG